MAGRARKAPARDGSHHGAFLAGALAFFLIMPSAGLRGRARLRRRTSPSTRSEADPTAPAPEASKPVLSWETGAGKSYLIPALDIIGFDVLLNQFDRHFIDRREYASNINTIRAQPDVSPGCSTTILSRPTSFCIRIKDRMYHGFARSAGRATGNRCSTRLQAARSGRSPARHAAVQERSSRHRHRRQFLGEPLFRMASLLLESGGRATSRFWREFGAAAISPPMGFNRLAFGDRFRRRVSQP